MKRASDVFASEANRMGAYLKSNPGVNPDYDPNKTEFARPTGTQLGGAVGGAINPSGSKYGAGWTGQGAVSPPLQQPSSNYFDTRDAAGYSGQSPSRQSQWVLQNGIYYGPNGQQMSPENYAKMQGGSSSSSFSSSGTVAAGGDAFQQAKAANEARYAEGKQLYDERYGRNMGYLEGAGNTEKQAIERRAADAKSASQQRLSSLGLSGTTIGQTLDAGVDQDAGRQYAALQERLNQQRLSADAGMSKDKIDFIERRNDIYPEAGYSSSSSSSSSANGNDFSAQGGRRFVNQAGPNTSMPKDLIWANGKWNDAPASAIFGKQLGGDQPTGVNLD